MTSSIFPINCATNLNKAVSTPNLDLLPIEKVEFSSDGSIQVRPQGAPANFLEVVDRLKVIEADNTQLEKGNDGLFRPKPET